MGNVNTTQETYEKIGFKVIQVVPESPAEKCGLVEFSDYVLSVNEKSLHEMRKEEIIELVKASEDKELHLEVYDSLSKTNRYLSLVPTTNWPGEGLLGIVIRLEAYEAVKDKAAAVEEPEIDIGFEAIYTNGATPVKQQPRQRAGSKLFKRISFSRSVATSDDRTAGQGHLFTGGVNERARTSSDINDATSSNASTEGAPIAKRPSATAKILRALSFTSSRAAGPEVEKPAAAAAESLDSSSSDVVTAGSETQDHNGDDRAAAAAAPPQSIFRKLSLTGKS